MNVSAPLSAAAAGLGEHLSRQAKVSSWRRCNLTAEASASHYLSLWVWQTRLA